MSSADGMISLTIDGQPVTMPAMKEIYDPVAKRKVPTPTTIYDAAQKLNILVPTLCHREYMNPVAVCRVCVVDVGVKNLAPACYRPIEPNMVVKTAATSPRVRDAVKVLTELLLAEHPSPCEKHRRHGDCELELLGEKLEIKKPRFAGAERTRPRDESSLVIAVDHNACILCDRCIRGCNDIRDNQVLGRAGKGYGARIAFDLEQRMGDSTCVACGECMVSCPTGALTNRSIVQPEPWKHEKTLGVVSADELTKLPLFEGISHAFLRFNEGAVVRRRFRDGEVICREGEFGSTAFLIEQGTVEIYLASPLKHVKSAKKGRAGRHGLFGLVQRFSSSLVGRSEDTRDEESSSRRFIPVDAPVQLAYENPIATMEAGDIFGEMTCMNNYPRSATVRAKGDVVVLEMLRNVLYILQRSNSSRKWLEERYRERAVENQLRNVSFLANLSAGKEDLSRFVEYLRDRVDLMQLNPGDVIFRQGDPAHDLYLIRIGFVKVSQNLRGGEQVLAYRGPGSYFGEIGILSHLPELAGLVPPGVRTATCSALDHVDLVRIKAEDFHQILNELPDLRRRLIAVARKTLEDDEKANRELQSVPLGDFLAQGLMNAQSLLVLDLQKCTRCDECTKACADAHDGVTRLIREGLRFDKYLVASSCRSCLDPYCMVGCPVGSIRRRNSREIIIEDWCIGCGLCASNCPYGNINMHPFPSKQRSADGKPIVQQKATLCDLCTDLDGQPSCVYACPHDAAHRYNGAEFREMVQRDLAGT